MTERQDDIAGRLHERAEYEGGTDNPARLSTAVLLDDATAEIERLRAEVAWLTRELNKWAPNGAEQLPGDRA